MEFFIKLHFWTWLLYCFYLGDSVINVIILFIWSYPLFLLSFLLSIIVIYWFNERFTYINFNPIRTAGISILLLFIGTFYIFYPDYSSENTAFTRQEKIEENFQELIPENEGKLSLVFLQEDDDQTDVTLQDISKGITEIQKSTYVNSIENGERRFPSLNMDESPLYILINKEGEVIFRSNSKQALELFLMEN